MSTWRADPPARTGVVEPDRRGLVPQVAGGSLWLSAAWTGTIAAAFAMVLAVVATAVCWLPASGGSGGAGSTLRAGLLTYLAALHGGVVVDGVVTQFVPLGMTLLAAAVVYRAALGLADVSLDLGETQPARLVAAVVVQALAFTAVTGVGWSWSALGTSRAPLPGVVVAGFLLAAAAGGAAMLRESALAEAVQDTIDVRVRTALRGGAAAAATYLAAGSLLAGGSLIAHHRVAARLFGEVGGGWSSVPILLLGVLTVPNVAIAAAGYLAGPGVAVGAGTHVSLGGAAHGTLPAFPPLAAVPTGGHGSAVAWTVAVLTPLVAAVLARRAVRAQAAGARAIRGRAIRGLGDRILVAAGSAAATGMILAVLAWLGGGGIGSDRLRVIGVSPWQLALASSVTVFGVWAVLGAAATARGWLRSASRSGDVTGSADTAETAAVALAARDAAPIVSAAVEPSPSEDGTDRPAGDDTAESDGTRAGPLGGRSSETASPAASPTASPAASPTASPADDGVTPADPEDADGLAS